MQIFYNNIPTAKTIDLQDKKTIKKASYNTTQQPAISENAEQKVYASNLSALGINFKGKLSDDEKTLEQLRNEYTWYVNHDKTDPLEAFLKIKTNEKAMNELFADILNDEDLSYDLIDSIAGKPRDAIKNYETLKVLLGDNSDYLKFFMYNNPYRKAFEKYLAARYENEKSIERLLKLRPDWRESALIDKYEKLHGNRALKIGKLPEDIDEETFEQIYNYLQSFYQYQGYKINTDIPPLTIKGKSYNFEYFTQGKTDKNVFGVYTPTSKYVFKMASPQKKSLNEPFSLGALALIDGYLTLNNCRNIAPLYYYEHDKNVCIYKYQEHKTVNHRFSSATEVNNYMPDFKALGMCYIDTLGSDNYFLSDTNCQHTQGNGKPTKELICVDNDHVTFSSPFMLMVTEYNTTLPNGMQTAF